MNGNQQQGMSDQVGQQEIQKITDGISDYLFGDAREHVAQNIAKSGEELDQTIAALAYQTVTQAAEQAKEQLPDAMSIDILLPVAAQTIDFLIEIAKAVGAPIKDEDDLRARAMIKMVQVHMAAVENDPEQKAMAEEMLAEMMEDGTYEQGVQFVNKKIKEEGGDPEKAQAMGQQMAAPRQNRLSAGVQQGLMEQGGRR